MSDDADDYDLPRYQTRTSARIWLELGPDKIDEISQALLRCPPSNAAVKSELANIADRHGIFCRKTGDDGKELLYDVVWTNRDAKFSDVYLICEIELARSKKSIFEDFRKLLIGKAPIKVMIFSLGQADHHKTVLRGDDFFEEMREEIFGFRNTEPGEIYILVEIGPSGKCDIIRVTHDHIFDSPNFDW